MAEIVGSPVDLSEPAQLQQAIDERIETALETQDLDLSDLDLPFFPLAVLSHDLSKVEVRL